MGDDPDALQRFERFSARHGAGADARECPGCGHWSPPVVSTGGRVQCEVCGLEVCDLHNLAHSKAACDAMVRRAARRTRRAEKKSLRRLGKTTRPCPKCGAPTTTAGGIQRQETPYIEDLVIENTKTCEDSLDLFWNEFQ